MRSFEQREEETAVIEAPATETEERAKQTAGELLPGLAGRQKFRKKLAAAIFGNVLGTVIAYRLSP
jgi:hypothetical protein